MRVRNVALGVADLQVLVDEDAARLRGDGGGTEVL